MFVQRKPVYAVTLDVTHGETPELLMTAIALAVFDLAPSLDEGDRQVLTAAQARGLVVGGREMSMSMVAGRMCFAHVIATRISGGIAEVALAMYDRDGDALMKRASRRMEELVADSSTEVFVDMREIIGDDAGSHEIPIEFFLESDDDADVARPPLTAAG